MNGQTTFESPPTRQPIARCLVGLLIATAAILNVELAHAEPYLAVESGLHCRSCHVNPTGGGKRNVFGTLWARNQLSETIAFPGEGPGWTGAVKSWLGVGGDYRGGYSDTDIPGVQGSSETTTTQGTVYLEVQAIPELLTLYVDGRVAPDQSETREAYALLKLSDSRYTIKAGQFFLPFGLRLHDDSAFVRERSGINFATPDDGVEFGLELPNWSAQFAVSNGTAGAGSESGRRQYSLSATHVRPRWRVGASLNINEDNLGDRSMVAVFAGYRTGPITWLAEMDFITDELPGQPDRDIYATLIEGNWRIRKAHNLKLSYDFVDPSDGTSEDERERYSILWEYTPVQLVQTRLGFRTYNGVPEDPLSNRDQLFAELHVYF
ncbi:MAG: OprO/OprP family phosphate-selective porin [Gammaproteobacteria bacterium]|nr:OprO/OprP family phosphate-selective porin [Gammaproteobacteria bacterium]